MRSRERFFYTHNQAYSLVNLLVTFGIVAALGIAVFALTRSIGNVTSVNLESSSNEGAIANAARLLEKDLHSAVRIGGLLTQDDPLLLRVSDQQNLIVDARAGIIAPETSAPNFSEVVLMQRAFDVALVGRVTDMTSGDFRAEIVVDQSQLDGRTETNTFLNQAVRGENTPWEFFILNNRESNNFVRVVEVTETDVNGDSNDDLVFHFEIGGNGDGDLPAWGQATLDQTNGLSLLQEDLQLIPATVAYYRIENDSELVRYRFIGSNHTGRREVVARNMPQFGLAYSFQNSTLFDGNFVMPEGFIDSLRNDEFEGLCGSAPAGSRCAEWLDLERVEIRLLQTAEERDEAFDQNDPSSGFIIGSNGELLRQSVFRLNPTNFIRLGATAQISAAALQLCPPGPNTRCSGLPGCAETYSLGSPTEHPNDLDENEKPFWIGYGMPVNPGATDPTEGASNYCVCGSSWDENGFEFTDPNVQPPPFTHNTWLNGTPQERQRIEACAAHFGCDYSTSTKMHPGFYLACNCFFDQATAIDNSYPREIPFDSELSLSDPFMSPPANQTQGSQRVPNCYRYRSCMSAANRFFDSSVGGNPEMKTYWTDECECRSFNFTSTGVTDSNPGSILAHAKNWERLCNLERQGDPNAAFACPNTAVLDPDDSTFRYLLANENLPNAMSREDIQLCECIKERYGSEYSFNPGTGLIHDFRAPRSGANDLAVAAAYPGKSLVDPRFGSSQVVETTNIEVLASDENQAPTLSTTVLGTNCAAHQCSIMSGAFGCCLGGADHSAVRESYRATHGGFCLEQGGGSPYRRCARGTYNNSMRADLDDVRRFITETDAGDPLPANCGGPADAGGGDDGQTGLP